MTPDDWNGWGRAWDQLVRRVDALEQAIKQLAGRPPDAPPPSEENLRVGGIGLGTWIAIAGVIVVPIVIAILTTQGGP